ncbi:BPI/LBP family protein [Salix suchowensis]|nr:BPI/LBP family protein [Salix suchowensis]
MAQTLPLFLLITCLLLIPSSQIQQEQEAFTTVVISQQGLDFLKNLLITQAISSIIPLKLPNITKTAKLPFLGNVRMLLSNITIYQLQVLNSYVKPGDTGLAIIASGTTCNLSMDWSYEYNTWIFPVEISDKGHASVQVEGMEVGLTLGLKNQEGTLKLSLMDCGCYCYISCSLKYLLFSYVRMIDAFEEQIGSAVENAITKNLGEGILKLDMFYDDASINVTFVDNPSLSNSSVGKKVPIPMYYYKNTLPSVLCTEPAKMLGISLDEAVFNSASALYYDAKFMQWIVDKIPDQSLLNTAGWRFIVPQLYKKYPNDDMNMNLTLSSPPILKISEHNLDATVYADLIIDVLEADQVIPVACISLVIRGSGSVGIAGNNLVGSVKLNDFSMSLKWSTLPLMWTLIQTVFVPNANTHLAKGFPLPIIHGFTVQNAEIIFSRSKITVCGDVVFGES